MLQKPTGVKNFLNYYLTRRL